MRWVFGNDCVVAYPFFAFRALMAADRRDLSRAAALACSTFFVAAWSSALVAARKAVFAASRFAAATASRTLRTCDFRILRVARLRARREMF